MAWLVRDGDVLASLEIAASLRDRTRGLLGRDGLAGAMLLRPARSVHTVRMRFAIDVAFCDGDLRVLRTMTMRPNRIARTVWKARCVIEAEAGAFETWSLTVGDQLTIRGDPGDGGHSPAPSPDR
jgi:uncharacterized membrane protein (UPF0127 family)